MSGCPCEPYGLDGLKCPDDLGRSLARTGVGVDSHDHGCCPPGECCGGPCAAHPCWDLTT